ncbi:MAG TPA: folate-binding protein [Devosia sp.]|nr:folate-binding protein [Devosia sp.]
MPLLQLSDRDVVRIAGEDAHKLLNDTLTCRFDAGLEGAGRWFALLSPQGKVQVEGLVSEAEGAFWFDLDGGLVPEFLKRMKLYRLRAKVEIEHLPSRAVLWSDGEIPAVEGAIVYRDSRAEGLGQRAIVPREDADRLAPPTGEELAYHIARVGAGVAEYGADFGVNEVFPHDIGMDFLGGVDFKKGCYIGQEVVSRMQHRGTARRRPVLVSGVPEGAAAGAPVMVGEREAGTIGGEVDGHAVAILRLDRVTGELATVGGLPVELSLPAWAPYRFGDMPVEG